MIFLAIAGIFGLLEVWTVLGGGHGEPALPEAIRIIGPIALAASAIRSKGGERLGIVLSAVVVFLFLNNHMLGNERAASSLIGVSCVALAAVGYSTWKGTPRANLGLLLIAASAAAVGYIGFVWWFVK
jgi:hypothetical protein